MIENNYKIYQNDCSVKLCCNCYQVTTHSRLVFNKIMFWGNTHRHTCHSVMSDSFRPHESQHARPPCPSPFSQSSLKLTSIESVMPSSYLILCHPLLLLPSIFPSIRVFSSESALHIRWPEDWVFSFSISSSNEYSGLISFRIDWFDLLAVQGILKSLLQHHSSTASIVRCSSFFMVQLSCP